MYLYHVSCPLLRLPGTISVECDMDSQSGRIITTVHHDAEDRYYVTGFERVGSYQRDISYYGAQTKQITAVIEQSLYCKQKMSLECLGTSATIDDWLLDAEGEKVPYHSRDGDCSCILDRACQQGSAMYVIICIQYISSMQDLCCIHRKGTWGDP